MFRLEMSCLCHGMSNTAEFWHWQSLAELQFCSWCEKGQILPPEPWEPCLSLVLQAVVFLQETLFPWIGCTAKGPDFRTKQSQAPVHHSSFAGASYDTFVSSPMFSLKLKQHLLVKTKAMEVLSHPPGRTGFIISLSSGEVVLEWNKLGYHCLE